MLPWRSPGGESPWFGENQSERTSQALSTLLDALPHDNLVWGGDWNHSLIGSELAGSKHGRKHIQSTISKLDMQVPTEELMCKGDSLHSVDHIAVPRSWHVKGAERISVLSLSDHDAYVVDVEQD